MPENDDFSNPIDPDKITDIPNIIEYAHNLGSAVVKPEDKGKIKGLSLSAMKEQTDMQLDQIHDQIKLLAIQAKKINDRKIISNFIYTAEIRFTPLINHTYHLYQKENQSFILSLIDPKQWGKSKNQLVFLASVKLLSDHTWEILKKSDAFDIET